MAAAGLALGPASDARAADARVRVLVAEGPGPYTIESGASRHVLSRGRDGLRLDGRPHPGPWRGRVGRSRLDGRELLGALEVRVTPAGLAVVNEVGLEDYVAGTVGSEMFARWEPAALRAQAVASRTYVLHQQRARRRAGDGRPWDVASGTAHQVYGGTGAETASVRAAVGATEGEILVWEGEPILAAFHSAAGGRTASAAEVWGRPVPYLVSQPVPGEEDSPDTYWRLRVSPDDLGRAAASRGVEVGTVGRVAVRERSPSGRVAALELAGTGGRGRLSGRTLRDALGPRALRSTLFEVRESGGGFVFVGSGRGHGVGMSQWGARALARRGLQHPEILRSFYPGTQLAQWRELAAVERGAKPRPVPARRAPARRGREGR